MRRVHPLNEILEAAMKREERLMDTEWPAEDVFLAAQELVPKTPPSSTPRPVGPVIRR